MLSALILCLAFQTTALKGILLTHFNVFPVLVAAISAKSTEDVLNAQQDSA